MHATSHGNVPMMQFLLDRGVKLTSVSQYAEIKKLTFYLCFIHILITYFYDNFREVSKKYEMPSAEATCL